MTQALKEPQSAARRLTIREYLDAERVAECKSEYHDGVLVSMAGGSLNHATIGLNFGTAMNRELRGKPCRPFNSDVRVSVPPLRRYFYPDGSIVCGPVVPDEHDPHAITNPTLVAEVVSPTSEGFDRGEKFSHYLRLESLRSYALIDQDRAKVTLATKDDDGRWFLSFFEGLDAVADLSAVGVKLSLRELYDRVVFPEKVDEPVDTRPAESR